MKKDRDFLRVLDRKCSKEHHVYVWASGLMGSNDAPPIGTICQCGKKRFGIDDEKAEENN